MSGYIPVQEFLDKYFNLILDEQADEKQAALMMNRSMASLIEANLSEIENGIAGMSLVAYRGLVEERRLALLAKVKEPDCTTQDLEDFCNVNLEQTFMRSNVSDVSYDLWKFCTIMSKMSDEENVDVSIKDFVVCGNLSPKYVTVTKNKE